MAQGNDNTSLRNRVTGQEHPALAAIDATKKQPVSYSTDMATEQNITSKEQQLARHFPTINMEGSQLHKLLSNMVNENPNKWYEVQQLAQDILDFYSKNKKLKKEKYPTNAGRWLNEHVNVFSNHIDDLYELAEYITGFSSNTTGISTWGGHLNPKVTWLNPASGAWSAANNIIRKAGSDRVQANNTKIFDDYISNVFPKIANATSDEAVKLLHVLDGKYSYEYATYKNTTGDTKSASRSRMESYIKAWNKLIERIKVLKQNPETYYRFLKAYESNPLKALTKEESALLNMYYTALQPKMKTNEATNMLADMYSKY